MIQINPLQSYIDGGPRAAITSPPSASLVFDLPGKAIWVKGVKLKGTDHTYTFSHDNYITLTNTPDSNESEDIKIGVNTSALKSAIDTTYGVVSTTANGLAPKFTSGNKLAASAATTYYFLGWTGTTLKWYQAPFRNIRINSETTDRLGVNSTDPLIISSGNGISVTWDSTNKKIVITNTKPDVNHNTDRTGIKLATVSGTKKTDSTLILANSTTGLSIQGGTNKFLIGNGTNYIEVPITPSFTVTNKDATIRTALTTIATIAGVDIKAKIASYSLSNHTHSVKINGSTKTIAASGAVDLGNYLPLSGGTMSGTAWIVWPDSGNWSNKNSGVTFPVIRGGLRWLGLSDLVELFSEEASNDNLNLVLRFGDDNSNGLSIRDKSNTQTSYISSSGVITTGTFKGNLDWSYITNKPSSYTPSAHTHTWNSLTHSSTTLNQAILTNGSANGWKLYTLNISGWNNAANNAHSHSNKSVLDGITSTLVGNWNTAYNFVNTISGTDTDKVINKWDEIVNFLAGISEDDKLNTLLNSKLSILLLTAKDILTTKTNNALFWVNTISTASSITTGPFIDHPYALLSVTNYSQNDINGKFFYRSRLAFSSTGDIKVASCHHENVYKLDETWYNVLTSKNSDISGSTIKLNGTSITVYSSSTADSRFVKKTGDTMSGALNLANNTWNRIGDDSYIGDCNTAGMIGIKAANTTYPGITFFNNENTRLGNLTVYSNNIKYRTYSLQFLDNGNTSVNASTWMNPFSTYNADAVADGQAICVWGQSSNLSNLAADSGNISLWLKRVNANGATLNMVLDGEYYANGSLRLAHVSEIPTSLKNPYALTISLNGKSQGPYDGSATKNVNITPSSIGAATSGHNHDSSYVKYAKVTKSTADSASANPYIYNIENEALISGYYNHWYILNLGQYSKGNFGTLIAMPYQDSLADSELFIRSAKNGSWRTWRRVLHSNNYAAILDSRYYTESEINTKLGAYLPLTGGTLSGGINFSNTSHLLWNSGSYHLRIFITDDSTADTAVFTFLQSSDSGTNWSNLMTIRDNGKVIANTFVGALLGNASTATKLTSSAGNAALPIYFSDGKPVACTASSIFSNLSNSGNNISVTVAGQNRTLTVAYATTSSMLKTSTWSGGAYVSSDTHYMCLGYMNCTNSYDALTLLISSAFWGNQHGSQDIITIQQDTNTNNTKTIQTTVGRLRLGGSHERTFYYYKDNTNLRLYLYVYVIGGNSYGKWNISYLGGNATWVNDWQTNVTKDTSWITIGYSAQVNYATSAGNATTATTLLTTRTLWGQSFNGSTNVSGNMSSVGLITFSTLSGTNGRALLYLQMADNDYFRIYAGGTASNSGYVEIATADDGNEPIYVRQYTGVFSTLKRTLTLLDGSGNTILPGSATATGFSKSGSSNSYILLGGGSHKAISDFMLKTDELSNNLTTISKSLTVTQAWMDTGIKNTDLPANGTYIVQVSAHNTADNIWHNYWSGIMSWYKDGTNDSDSDEIILHRAGHAYHHTIYLRTIMTTNSDGRHLRLQIAADTNLSTAVTYTFKFKRVI